MSNDKVTGNALFSPGNTINFASNQLFVPVQEQTSAIFSPEKDPEEEGSFIGGPVNSKTQDVATFSLFSRKSEPSTLDPFASLESSNSNHDQTSQASSEHHEPQLVVPPASPTSSATCSTAASLPPNMSQPPLSQLADHPPRSNPYARVSGGHRVRPMFPSNNQYFQTPSSTPQHLTFTPAIVPDQQPTQADPSNTVSPPPSNFSPPSFEKLASDSPLAPPLSSEQPLLPHWFYCKNVESNKMIWYPFSNEDSNRLEAIYQKQLCEVESTDTISTDGGRYDVTITQRVRRSVYWDEPQTSVRRCTWFYKADNANLFSPYDEGTSEKLEKEYQNVVKNGLWHKGIDLGGRETVVVHNPQLIVHYQPLHDDFGAIHDKQQRSKIVKRGIASTDFIADIPANELGFPDHLVFVCHGVGPVCDLRSRSIVECVDDFRRIQLSLLQSHFKSCLESGKAQRIEFLPIHWHRALHGDATGVDRSIRRLTLPSISRLRHFTNETLLDILFYSSPVYCQTIAETIGNEINSLYQRFLSRNPGFSGKVSLAGHSLGSLILFDLLCHQAGKDMKPSTAPPSTQVPLETHLPTASDTAKVDVAKPTKEEIDEPPMSLEEALHKLNLDNFVTNFQNEQIDMETLQMCSENDLKDIGIPLGPRKKLMGFLKDESERIKQLKTSLPQEDMSVGVAMQYLPPPDLSNNVQQAEQDDTDLSNSILSSAMNVHVDFQQFDSGTGQPAVCYPKLDFNPHALFALGSPIGMFLTVRGITELGEDFSLPTCPSFINIFHPFDPVAYRVEPLINPDHVTKPVLIPHYKGRKRLHLELKESLGRMGQELKEGIMKSFRLAIGSMQKFAQSHWSQTQETTQAAVEEEVHQMTEELMRQSSSDNDETASATSDLLDDSGFGRLNGGRRVDYVLQERPLESFNDYLFAFQSHLCYWNSEDTVLLMMKDIYSSMDVLPDNMIVNKQKSQQNLLE